MDKFTKKKEDYSAEEVQKIKNNFDGKTVIGEVRRSVPDHENGGFITGIMRQYEDGKEDIRNEKGEFIKEMPKSNPMPEPKFKIPKEVK